MPFGKRTKNVPAQGFTKIPAFQWPIGRSGPVEIAFTDDDGNAIDTTSWEGVPIAVEYYSPETVAFTIGDDGEGTADIGPDAVDAAPAGAGVPTLAATVHAEGRWTLYIPEDIWPDAIAPGEVDDRPVAVVWCKLKITAGSQEQNEPTPLMVMAFYHTGIAISV